MTDLSQIEWRWDKKAKEYVAVAYGREIAVRRTEGNFYSAHYGHDRYRIGNSKTAYSTVARAKAAAERYLADVLNQVTEKTDGR